MRLGAVRIALRRSRQSGAGILEHDHIPAIRILEQVQVLENENAVPVVDGRPGAVTVRVLQIKFGQAVAAIGAADRVGTLYRPAILEGVCLGRHRRQAATGVVVDGEVPAAVGAVEAHVRPQQRRGHAAGGNDERLDHEPPEDERQHQRHDDLFENDLHALGLLPAARGGGR